VPGPAAEADNLAALRRLKEAETEGELTLRTVRGEGERLLRELRESSEATVREARTRSDEAARVALEKAQQQAQVEADRLVESARAAILVRPKPSDKEAASLRDRALEVLVGDLTPSGSKSRE
jgi:vacuolar-type H+-ATPase subunit H